MAQLATGYPRFAPPPPVFSFRPSPRPPPPPPPPPSSYKALSIDSSRARGEVAGLVFFCGFCFLVLTSMIYMICSMCWCQRNRNRALWAAYAASRAAAATAAGPETPPESSSSVRVDEQPLHRVCAASPTAGLPMFTYSQSVKHSVTGPGEEAATCSVCLGALQLGETVRLLPACLHMYHAECIDPWLDAHSTCPICRSETDPTMGVGLLQDI